MPQIKATVKSYSVLLQPLVLLLRLSVLLSSMISDAIRT